MKKPRSPWYGLVWITVWSVAMVWLLKSEMFNFRESIGLVTMWVVIVGVTVYAMVKRLRIKSKAQNETAALLAAQPKLNAPCPCGSGKKYKRCCGVKSTA